MYIIDLEIKVNLIILHDTWIMAQYCGQGVYTITCLARYLTF